MEAHCSSCGVGISPSMELCGFCARKASYEVSERRTKVRVAIVAAALVAVTAVCGALWYRQSTIVDVRPEPVRVPQPVVKVTETEVAVDGKRLLQLDSLDEQALRGVDARFKARGPNDLAIVPLVTALAERRARAAQGSDPLAIELAPRTPYRLMMEIIFSADQGGARRFLLSMPAAGAHPSIEFESETPGSVLEASKPAGPALSASGAASAVPQREPSTYIAILIARDGFSLKFQGGNVAPGCEALGAGLAVPKRDGYDLPGLVACLKRVNSEPAVAVRDGIVAANPGVEVATVLEVASTLRCGEPSCHGRQLGLPFMRRVTFGVVR
jgi:hypothetical protein